MLAVSALAAVLHLAAAPSSQVPATRLGECSAATLRVGPVDAPIEVTAYLDPFSVATFNTWLELRRLVADHEGALRVRIVPTSLTLVEVPDDTRILRLLFGAGARGRLEAALRILDREGRDRLGVRLADPASRAAVAAELDLHPDDLGILLEDRCADAAARAGKDELRRLHHAAGGFIGRPPVFAVGRAAAFAEGSSLERLRLELAGEVRRLRRTQPLAPAPVAAPRGVSSRLIRPPASAGMLIGGVGLPHRLVIFADHDEHPGFSVLGPVLEFRRQHPGVLAIQVIARGTGVAARSLRVRTCVAERLELQLGYLSLLAREGEGARREPYSAAAREFMVRLDESPEAETCDLGEPELEPGTGGVTALPEGMWLDGTAVGHGELDALTARLTGADPAQSPLDAVFSPAASEP